MNLISRGIRGAISVDENSVESILKAASELLESMVTINQLQKEDVSAVIFTTTSDLDAVYPAVAARKLGWTQTPLMCTQEMHVQGSMPRCLRVLVLWNTTKSAAQIHHVYLGEARKLRPDLLEEKS